MDIAASTGAFSHLSDADRQRIPADVEAGYPLSVRQAGLLFDVVPTGEAVTPHRCATVRLRGPFDAPAFGQAARDTVRRHPALRTSFALAGFAEGLQLVHRHRPSAVQVRTFDLRGRTSEEQQIIIDDAVASQRRQPFPLYRPTLVRIVVHVLSDVEFQLTTCENHIVLDSWGWTAVIAEILERHQQLIEYTENYTSMWAALPGAADIDLSAITGEPRDERWPRPTGPAPRLADLQSTGFPAVARMLISRAASVPITAAIAVHVKVLSDLFGVVQPCGMIGNRPYRDPVDRVIVGTVRPGWSWTRIAEAAVIEGMSAATRSDIGLVILDAAGWAPDVAELGGSGPAVLVTWRSAAGRVEVELLYDADQLSIGRMELIARAYTAAIERYAADPDIGHDDAGPLLAVGVSTVSPAADTPAIGDLVADIVAAATDAPALRSGDNTLSGRGLVTNSTRIAATLIAAGVGAGDVVGLDLRAGLDLVTAMLGVWRAGAAYLLIEAQPTDARLLRLAAMFDVAAVLTDGPASAQRLSTVLAGGGVAVLAYDVTGRAPTTLPKVPVDGLAYLVPVTGKAAVVVSRRQLAAAISGIGAEHRPARGDVVACDPRIGELGSWMIWSALAEGASVALIAADEVSDATRVHDLLRRAGVARYVTTRSGALELAVADRAAGVELSIERLYVIADGAGPTWLETTASARLRSRLYHVFGAIETAAWAIGGRVDGRERHHVSVSIGRARPGATVWILDAEMRPVPDGFAGELYLGGADVGFGYLGDPRLTASRFRPDPFTDRPGSRLFRTGDLARVRSDGALELAGPADSGRRIHGRLLDLDEVTWALRDQDGVRDAAVIADGSFGQRDVIAYVVGKADAPRLLERLSEVVPAHAVPRAVVRVDRLPRTADGSVDVGALPEPTARDFLGPPAADPPCDIAEAVLSVLWADLFGCDNVGVRQRFRDIGGDDLQLTRMLLGIRQRLGIRVTYSQIGDDPTIAEIATVIRPHMAFAIHSQPDR